MHDTVGLCCHPQMVVEEWTALPPLLTRWDPPYGHALLSTSVQRNLWGQVDHNHIEWDFARLSDVRILHMSSVLPPNNLSAAALRPAATGSMSAGTPPIAFMTHDGCGRTEGGAIEPRCGSSQHYLRVGHQMSS